MVENLPNLVTSISLQIPVAQQKFRWINLKKIIGRHITIKLLKAKRLKKQKKKNLKANRKLPNESYR